MLAPRHSGSLRASRSSATRTRHASNLYYAKLIGPHADEVLELLERFDAHHPRDEPHYYLSLLGTHPDHRGNGRGMGLLAANLATIDDLAMPAYLESSNRANDHRYERLGFVRLPNSARRAAIRPSHACGGIRGNPQRSDIPRNPRAPTAPPLAVRVPESATPGFANATASTQEGQPPRELQSVRRTAALGQ